MEKTYKSEFLLVGKSIYSKIIWTLIILHARKGAASPGDYR